MLSVPFAIDASDGPGVGLPPSFGGSTEGGLASFSTAPPALVP